VVDKSTVRGKIEKKEEAVNRLAHCSAEDTIPLQWEEILMMKSNIRT
jgi:hypothetical protein